MPGARKPRHLHRYAWDVLRGRVVTGELVRLACERALRDHEPAGGAARGLVWRPDRVDRVLRFFPLLCHWQGEWAGQPFTLEPWQQFILAELFGWYRADGKRRFHSAHAEVARKNGKTELLAGVGLYMLTADDEAGAQVYTAATKRDQAAIMHESAVRMVRASKPLSRRLQLFKTSILDQRSASTFKPLGADSKTLDGLNAHCALVDELHAHPSGELYSVLETSMGARRNPLIFSITTAGDDVSSFCYSQREYGERVLRGTLDDDSAFFYIASLDDGDDWRDPKLWPKANPNLGVTIRAEELAEKVEQAKEAPHRQNQIRRYRLNQWVRQTTRWLDLAKWDACAGELMPAELERSNEGRIGFGGLDLASTTDVAALAIVFPPDDLDTGTFDVIWRYWIPEDGIVERSKQAKVPFNRWEAEGWILATPGGVTDYADIRSEIIHLGRERYAVKQIAFDPWNATSLSTELSEEGFEMVKVGQNFSGISEAMKQLERLILSGRIRHGGHPVSRWMADNIEARERDGAIRPVKPNSKMSTKKIDGMVALMMALDRAMRRAPSTSSVYDERGLFVL